VVTRQTSDKKMEKFLLKIMLLTFLWTGCSEHDKSNIDLIGYNDTKEVIYDTELAKFYFSRSELENYCKEQDNGGPNNFMYRQILAFINDNKTNPVIIPDTLGTKMGEDIHVKHFEHRDTLVRIRNQDSPYDYVTDALNRVLIKFSKDGKLKVFDKGTGRFVTNIIVDEVKTSWYGSTNIHLTNDSLIFSKLNWIK